MVVLPSTAQPNVAPLRPIVRPVSQYSSLASHEAPRENSRSNSRWATWKFSSSESKLTAASRAILADVLRACWALVRARLKLTALRLRLSTFAWSHTGTAPVCLGTAKAWEPADAGAGSGSSSMSSFEDSAELLSELFSAAGLSGGGSVGLSAGIAFSARLSSAPRRRRSRPRLLLRDLLLFLVFFFSWSSVSSGPWRLPL